MGAECAQVTDEEGVFFSTIVAGATQEIGYDGKDEFVGLYRTRTPSDAAKWFDWAQRFAAACEKNEGISVFTNVDLGIPGAVGITGQLKSGSESGFTSFAQRGDLFFFITNENSDGTSVGAATTKYVLSYIDNLVAGQK
jgi:hypothetical protein